MAEVRRKFDPDFRAGAVRIVKESGKPIAQVARDLCINEGTRANWVAPDRQAMGPVPGALADDDRAELAMLRRDNAELAMERDVSSAPWLCGSKRRWAGDGGGVHRLPESRAPGPGHRLLPGAGCVSVLVLPVARPGAHTRQDRQAELADAVWESFHASGFTYGSPRVWLDLHEAGWRVSVNTVAAVMAEHGWAGRKPPRRRSLTRPGRRPAVPDLVGLAGRGSAPCLFRDVIAVARQGDRSRAQVARSFGISESCLARWLRIADREDGISDADTSPSPTRTAAEGAEVRELRRRNKQLEQKNEILQPGDGLLRPGHTPKMMLPLVCDLAADKILRIPVAVTCRVLDFTKQASYAWRAAPVSRRDWNDAHLAHHGLVAGRNRVAAEISRIERVAVQAGRVGSVGSRSRPSTPQGGRRIQQDSTPPACSGSPCPGPVQLHGRTCGLRRSSQHLGQCGPAGPP